MKWLTALADRLLEVVFPFNDQPYLPCLLGEGIDDIIQRTPRALSNEERLLRYLRAKHFAYADSPSQQQMLVLRVRLGEHYRSAWRDGRFPRFHAMSRRPATYLSERRSEGRTR